MSVKIGVGFGGWPFPSKDPDHLWEYTDECERLDVDSLWLSDRIVGEAVNVEPMIALSFIAARTKKLKFGTNVLALPLRNPTVLAKEIATLDYLSGGRSLPAVGLGTGDAREYEACGVPKRQRGGRTDEAIEVMRCYGRRTRSRSKASTSRWTASPSIPSPCRRSCPQSG